MFKNTLLGLAVIGVLSFTFPVKAFYSPIWFINDPMRDGNWWLKQAKEAILHAERLMERGMQIAQDHYLSMEDVLLGDARTSTIIQGKTTAISETKNRYSEDRYTMDNAKNLICGAINKAKEQSASYQCDNILERASSTYSLISFALGGTFPVDNSFNNYVIQNSSMSSQPNNDRQYVETMAKQIDSSSTILSAYSIITPEEYDSTMVSVDSIFGMGANTKSASEIIQYKLPNGAHQVDRLRKSLLYRSFIEDSLSRRTVKGDLAIDGAVIDDGSMEAHVKRIETLNKATMSTMAERHQAIFTAKQLNSSMVSLKKNINHLSINALKLKELRNGHE